MSEIIKLTNLTTGYGDTIIHDSISFDIKKGEIFGILGGSGSGKSSLLRSMLFLNTIKSGSIEIFGENIWNLPLQSRHIITNRCGVLFQFGALFSSMSVLDNVGILLSEYSSYEKSTIDKNSKMWLSIVGLDSRVWNMYPYELSGGMKKRVALARALALSPDILFLDEPTSGLDPSSSEKFDKLILKLRELLSITIVMVTHDLDCVRDCMDRFIILQDKKILFCGDLDGLSQRQNRGELFSNKRGDRVWKGM